MKFIITGSGIITKREKIDTLVHSLRNLGVLPSAPKYFTSQFSLLIFDNGMASFQFLEEIEMSANEIKEAINQVYEEFDEAGSPIIIDVFNHVMDGVFNRMAG